MTHNNKPLRFPEDICCRLQQVTLMENMIQWRVDGMQVGTGETNGNFVLPSTVRHKLHLYMRHLSQYVLDTKALF